MARVRVKICGVRSLEEAGAALDAGADALGFNFWSQSPRHISPEAARAIIEGLPPLVSCIGVFVNEQPAAISRIASALGLTAVQLHGDESAEFCRRLEGVRIIKAVRVGPDFDPASIALYRAGAILLDSSVRGNYGGTGQVFDWRAAVEAKKYARIILAGGLTVNNVVEAIEQVRPLAIDVCSGVEAEPGRKDLVKLREFMAAVAEANSQPASN